MYKYRLLTNGEHDQLLKGLFLNNELNIFSNEGILNKVSSVFI